MADVENSTPNLLDTIKTNIETTFSEKNIKDAVGKLNEFGEKATDLGKKVFSNIQSALSSDSSTPAP
jgi:hypothetical protein